MAVLRISYEPDRDDSEGVYISFDIEDDPHISTIHRLVKQGIAAMGYAEKSIEEYFGETCFED